ncbi:MAG: hypothetical protein ACE14S_10170, partial [Candidatus Bathyarchaeia archaeon]
GTGISSAYVDFALNASGNFADYHAEYAVNVTSALNVSGEWAPLNATHRQVSLTCEVSNEAKLALAKEFALYYKDTGGAGWTQASDVSIRDRGNGTYLVSFDAQSQDNPLRVSVHCINTRGIVVWANVTCPQA